MYCDSSVLISWPIPAIFYFLLLSFWCMWSGISLWFGFAFSLWQITLNIFMYLLATCTFFGEMSIQVFCLFLNWVVCLFSHWVIRVLYAGYYTLIRYRVKSMLFSSVHYILFFSVAFFAARKFLILRMHNLSIFPFLLVQLSSATHSCLTLCDPMDCSTPGFPVHHQLQFTQTHVHWVGDAIQPSHPLHSPSPSFNLF